MSLQKDLRQAQQLDAVVANAEAGATRRRPTRTAPSLESVVMDIVRASEERLLKTIEGLEARLAVAEGRGAEDPAATQSAATGGAEEPAAPPPVVARPPPPPLITGPSLLPAFLQDKLRGDFLG